MIGSPTQTLKARSMMPGPLKRFVVIALHHLGYELRPAEARSTLLGSLRQAKMSGLAPTTVIDIGAAWGAFTLVCQAVFPAARYVLVEPLDEFQAKLLALKSARPGVEIVKAVAAPQAGTAQLHVHPDLVGTSLLLEQNVAGVNGEPRTVPAVCLNDLAVSLTLAGPFLIKLDVQGTELGVLEGATDILSQAEYVLLEVSLFHFFEGGPLLTDVVQYMQAHGFVPYDTFGAQYRPLDGALAQLDMAFVREHGQLRASQAYATAEQRRLQWKERSGRI